MSPHIVARTECIVGENPLWNPIHKKLYWCDIPSGKIYRYDPDTGRHAIVYDNGIVGGFTVQTDGSLLLFGEGGQILHWKRGETNTIIDKIPEERSTRFNDVQADPCGRVFCGTMPTEDRAGRLYRLDTDQSLERVVNGLDIPNGMGFDPNEEVMYLTESGARTIWRYSYHESTGKLSNRERFVEIAGDGVPDGLTVDESGNIWSARWDGYGLWKYSPSGRKLNTVDLPTKKVSSATFGNEDGGVLYVSTARGGKPEENGTVAGSLFRFEPEEAGPRPYLSSVSV